MDTIFGLGAGSLAQLKNGNARVLFITRAVRMAAYGSCGVVLALYLSAAGLSDERIGILLTGTLVGDAAISLAISLLADRLGRRHMLMFGCLLKVLGAAVFAYVSGPQFWLLLFGATVGVISPSGNEVGPFMALEQSMLTDQVDPATRTSLFAWYNLVGYVSTALGSLATGFLSTYLMQHYDFSEMDSYRIVFVQYGGLGVCLAGLTLFLTSSVEAASWQAAAEERRAAQQAAAESKRAAKRVKDAERDGTTEPLLGDAATTGTISAAADGQAEGEAAAHVTAKPAASTQASFFGLSSKSRGIVAKLSFLFSMDSFGGGLVTGSLIVYYFKVRFNVGNDYLGGLLFVANIIAGISSLAAGWVASKVGLINTMVVTHLPSNVLLMLVPVMPTLELATAMLFLRYSISQMDVAPRQSYVSGIVPAHERTATMGITNIVKSLGAALGPSVTGYLAANGMFDYAFYLAGGIKILYDLLLLWSFQSQRAEHETVGRS